MKLQNLSWWVIASLLIGAWCVRAQNAEQENPFTWGADVRLRLTHVDRDVYSPDGAPPGDAVEYLRVRERLWIGYKVNNNIDFKARLTNMWRDYSSHIAEPNDQDNGSTWRFPDEIILDNFQVVLKNDEGDLQLSLGRQDVILGNGMVVLEGTPFDAGRTIYDDGAVASVKTETATLRFLGLYNRYRDDFVLFNDRTRPLRGADTGIAGAYFTFNVDPAYNLDAYYLYAELDDARLTTYSDPLPRQMADIDDFEAELHIIGGRLFGDVPPVFGESAPSMRYSAELAHQGGHIGPNRTQQDAWLGDARLYISAPPETAFNPQFLVEYTHMSGDRLASQENEGWFPYLGSAYPIWREELMANQNRGNWTNLNQILLKGTAQVHERVSWTLQYQYMWADESAGYRDGVGRDRDNFIGHLYSTFVDIQVMDKWWVKLEAAFLEPGNWYADGHGSEWLRLETTYTF